MNSPGREAISSHIPDCSGRLRILLSVLFLTTEAVSIFTEQTFRISHINKSLKQRFKADGSHIYQWSELFYFSCLNFSLLSSWNNERGTRHWQQYSGYSFNITATAKAKCRAAPYLLRRNKLNQVNRKEGVESAGDHRTWSGMQNTMKTKSGIDRCNFARSKKKEC